MAVRCSVPIDKKKKDDGKYEIMMAVTMTQQEGPTALAMPTIHSSSIRSGVRH